MGLVIEDVERQVQTRIAAGRESLGEWLYHLQHLRPAIGHFLECTHGLLHPRWHTGDRFLVDGTTYTGALNLLAVAGAQVVGVASDDDGPDMGSLERLSRGDAKGLYLMPNCHNPTGR